MAGFHFSIFFRLAWSFKHANWNWSASGWRVGAEICQPLYSLHFFVHLTQLTLLESLFRILPKLSGIFERLLLYFAVLLYFRAREIPGGWWRVWVVFYSSRGGLVSSNIINTDIVVLPLRGYKLDSGDMINCDLNLLSVVHFFDSRLCLASINLVNKKRISNIFHILQI